MPTFSDRDVIRIYVEHLDADEQERVEEYFLRNAQEPPPPPPPPPVEGIPANETNLREGLENLAACWGWLAFPTGTTGSVTPPLATSISVSLAWGSDFANDFKDFLDEYNVNEYIATYKDFFQEAQRWEDEMKLVLNDDFVDRIFYMLRGINSVLNAIQLLEDIGDDVINSEPVWTEFLRWFEFAADELQFHQHYYLADLFPGQVRYPGTTNRMPYDANARSVLIPPLGGGKLLPF